MKLEYNETQLLELMRNFYITTGIRIVLFDDEYQELLSYPEENCTFCQMMKLHEDTRNRCIKSDAESFRQCGSSRELFISHCHAGLIEATIPLMDNHIIIGYLMFGQISDCRNTDDLRQRIRACLKRYDLPETRDCINGIPLKSEEQIYAAAKIMEACTFYALFNETIALRRHNFTNNLRSFLLEHLSEPLDAGAIADYLNISRSKLYLSCDKYLGTGIAEYLRNLRIERAKVLLKTTAMTITEISAETGFSDYNYFCKVFKKITGMTPKSFRG